MNLMNAKQPLPRAPGADHDDEHRIAELLSRMTLEEKIGQLSQLNADAGDLRERIRSGNVGSILNEVDVDTVNELQRIAVKESRIGIPLLVGRDVIHGFRTILPIPIGQASSWNPALIRDGARVAAVEAAAHGVNWTFAPMIDITRDPRWGRIAESLGEDPVLCSALGVAMVQGFQGDSLADSGSIAACAKHFVGYGGVEAGVDYSSASIPEIELRDVHLRPFEAAVEAGVATIMAAFNDLNGVPATANEFLMRQVLREEWGFSGFVVSDWNSIPELVNHGIAEDDVRAACAAARAGIDMEMASRAYPDHLPGLIESGAIPLPLIDDMVSNVLRLKYRLGLFESPFTDPRSFPPLLDAAHLALAHELALQSCVLLSNRDGALPLKREALRSLAVIGPLADDGYEQLGTWVFDGDARDSRTCLRALQALLGDAVRLNVARGLEGPRSRSEDLFPEAIRVTQESDAVVLVLGEDSILSGEAHCRADISLPGAQERLIEAVCGAASGKPVILVVMAGRPLTLASVCDRVSAILYAWHPGTMGGPAIAELLFGLRSPSGKLPVTFPRMVGQVPIHHARKNTGRPPAPGMTSHIDTIDARAPQTSLGMTAFHLDAGYTPLFAFGHGLSYTHFSYSQVRAARDQYRVGEIVEVFAQIRNEGDREAEEVAQLYVRDVVGSVTRPVRELKAFQRIRLAPGESRSLVFRLPTDALAFHDARLRRVVEPGRFLVWVGGSSEATEGSAFELIEAP